jgi:metal-dependent amidase/aminoacylase/carboxypeptidase family protein
MTTGTELAASLLAAVESHLPAAQNLRHQVHRNPDLGGHEQRTAAIIAAALGDPGAPWVTEGRLVRISAGHGPAEHGPHVAVRAELDALPLTDAAA